MTNTTNQKDSSAASGLIAAQEFLKWNRMQKEPPVVIPKELGVFRKAMQIAEACRTQAPQAATPLPGQDERIAAYVLGQWFDARTLDEMQAFYLSRLPVIREAAKEHGYAIGLHGSLRRDFDLMAMPWRESAADKDTLAHAIANAACGITCDGPYQWEQKPNGRFAVSIPICWPAHDNPDFDKPSAGHIDLSVLTQQAAPEAPARRATW